MGHFRATCTLHVCMLELHELSLWDLCRAIAGQCDPMQVLKCFFHGTTRFLGLSFPFSHCTEDPQRTVILATGHGYSYVFPCKTLENNGPGYISVPIFSVLCQRWEHTRKPATVEWVRQNLSAGLCWGVGIMMLLCSLFTPSWTKTSSWWQTG